MALWHDFAWENEEFSLPYGSSDAFAQLVARNVVLTRFYSKDDFDCYVFSSRSTLASAVSAARTYIYKHFDQIAVLEESWEYETRGYFTMRARA